MFKKIFLLTLSILISAGCATTSKYEAVLDSWLGHDINDLVNSWGYPVDSFKAPNGNYANSDHIHL